MQLEFYLLLLTAITVVGGSIPFLFKHSVGSFSTLLLAFSGSFLFGITCLHLMPESFVELGSKSGLLILIGFFFQLLLQRLSHGLEHGHVHVHEPSHSGNLVSIFLGLSIHAFLEGIPLGFNYQNRSTLPSIFLGVAAHKLPEALTLSTLLLSLGIKKNKWAWVIFFALVSPMASLMAMYYGEKFYFISSMLTYVIPIVIGSFLHISTTILYESGTKHHELSKQKVLAVMVGIGLALATLLLH